MNGLYPFSARAEQFSGGPGAECRACNHSTEILRRVEVGESFAITNHAAHRWLVAAPEATVMLLRGVGMIDVDRAVLLAAAKDPHRLRSADALYAATALAVDADLIVTYDRELFEAAEGEALEASCPGA